MKVACDRCERVINMDCGEEKRKILKLETGSGLRLNLCEKCADGVSGIYIRPEEMVINPAKLKPHDGGMEGFDPERILTDTVRTERTKTAMILDKRLAVKFTGAGGGCWVNLACLKGYDTGEVAYYLNSALGVIVFVDRNIEEPVGFCMTMKVDDE